MSFTLLGAPPRWQPSKRGRRLTTTSAPKHRLIYETVHKDIRSGTYRPGDRIPSESEFVQQFNVSRPTVARALRDLERSGLITRRPGSGTYVKQAPQRDEKLFGLLIPGLGSTEIFEPICAEMARVAQENHHGILWGSSTHGMTDDDMGELAIQLCQKYVAQRVGGVFFAPLELIANKDEVNRQVVDQLEQAGIPVVLLDRDYLPFPERSRFDLVGIDNRRAGFVVTSHLLERGAKNVHFLAMPGSAATVDARIAGYWEALLRQGLTPDPKAVHRGKPTDLAFVESMVKLGADAIVCGNDVTAGRLLHSLDELNIKVPDRVMVTGFDDVRYAELLRVPLTTINQPCSAIGDAAFEAMLNRIASPDAPPRDILLQTKLVVRESTNRSPRR